MILNSRPKPAATPMLVGQNSGPVVAVRYPQGLPEMEAKETSGVESLRLRISSANLPRRNVTNPRRLSTHVPKTLTLLTWQIGRDQALSACGA